jgi:hypothetical protein
LTSAAQYADLAIDNVVNDGTPGAFQNLANPAATGQFIGAFVSGSVLTLATPAEILSATSPTTAAIGATSVSVNFNGTFGLLLDVYGGGPPAGYLFSLLVDESICTLSSAGSDIVFTTTP